MTATRPHGHTRNVLLDHQCSRAASNVLPLRPRLNAEERGGGKGEVASETANARQPSEHAQQSTPNRIQRSSHHTEKGRLLVYVHKLVLANLLWSKVDHVSAVRPILHLHGAAVKHLPLWTPLASPVVMVVAKLLFCVFFQCVQLVSCVSRLCNFQAYACDDCERESRSVRQFSFVGHLLFPQRVRFGYPFSCP